MPESLRGFGSEGQMPKVVLSAGFPQLRDTDYRHVFKATAADFRRDWLPDLKNRVLDDLDLVKATRRRI